MRPSARLAISTLILASTSCDGAERTAPEHRSVAIRTTACGDASATTGSGIVIDDALVLTAAHVVVGASEIEVTGQGTVATAGVRRLDVTRDLALLHVDGLRASTIEFAGATNGDTVTIVGGASSGSVEAVIERPVLMTVDDVRGTERHERDGYELAATTAGGDSGAGVYAGDRLVAVVFSESTGRDGITFAVGATEIEVMLATDDALFVCDGTASRVVPAGS